MNPDESSGTDTTTGAPGRHLPTVLFLCVHNAGRSQMALGWFTHLAGGQARALSGGSEPANELNRAAVEVMAEVGIDIAHQVPRTWTPDMLDETDIVITMGCGDTCPVYPGKHYEDWPLDDPAGRGLDDVRTIRDQVRERVEALLTALNITPRP